MTEQAAEGDGGRIWFPDDQNGYSIALCECDDGPYLGARRMGTPCRCERCGRLTPEQWEFLAEHVRAEARPPGRPQGGMKSEAGRAAYWRMNYESAIGALADLIAENTENVTAIREALESLDLLCVGEDRHGEHIRAHEVRGAVADLRVLVTPPGATT